MTYSLKPYLKQKGISCQFEEDGNVKRTRGCDHTFRFVVEFGEEVAEDEGFMLSFAEMADDYGMLFDCDCDFYINAPYDIIIITEDGVPFLNLN